jgi:hypothetical protein
MRTMEEAPAAPPAKIADRHLAAVVRSLGLRTEAHGQLSDRRRQALAQQRTHLERQSDLLGTPASTLSIDNHQFNRYLYIDERRSGADPEDQASAWRAVLRAGRVSRRRARTGATDGRDRQSPRRPGAASAR